MAQITVNVPDAQVARVRDAFAAEFDYDNSVPRDVNNNPTMNKVQWVQFCVTRMVKNVVRNYETTVAETNARTSVVDVDAT